MAIKVTLRKKKISKGRKSLFLDFYPAIPSPKTGEPTRREFLGLYLFEKPKNPIDKQHNVETLQIAESISQKRHNELNKPEIYTEFEKGQLRLKQKGEQDFVTYFEKMANSRKASNYDNWISALNYLKTFSNGEKLKFVDLNLEVLEDFKQHLLTAKSNRSDKVSLSQNSAVSYFNKVKAALKKAYKEGMLAFDLNAQVEGIKAIETHREYLTLEEVNKLVKTECSDPLMKRAALFSCLTGLRFSDIQKIVWKEIFFEEGIGYFIKFTQKKTKGAEQQPISEQAYSLLGERMDSNQKVFDGLKYSAYKNKQIEAWILDAKIAKKITFHCFRHTYATLQLAHGTDIYTVSKMLGHRELKTTQVYTKVVDQAKREAADKIKLDL